jgi:hypothetical protein
MSEACRQKEPPLIYRARALSLIELEASSFLLERNLPNFFRLDP